MEKERCYHLDSAKIAAPNGAMEKIPSVVELVSPQAMSRTHRIVAFVALVAALATVCAAFGRSPAITNLPGYGKTKESSFAGYLPITANGATDNALFYWMFQSRSNPASDRTFRSW